LASAPRHLAEELLAGPVRGRLGEVLGLRALLPIVRVRSRMQPIAVLNADAKAVVRLELERPKSRAKGRAPTALAPRLRARPVLGYDT
jgi:hypothetical protein